MFKYKLTNIFIFINIMTNLNTIFLEYIKTMQIYSYAQENISKTLSNANNNMTNSIMSLINLERTNRETREEINTNEIVPPRNTRSNFRDNPIYNQTRSAFTNNEENSTVPTRINTTANMGANTMANIRTNPRNTTANIRTSAANIRTSAANTTANTTATTNPIRTTLNSSISRRRQTTIPDFLRPRRNESSFAASDLLIPNPTTELEHRINNILNDFENNIAILCFMIIFLSK